MSRKHYSYLCATWLLLLAYGFGAGSYAFWEHMTYVEPKAKVVEVTKTKVKKVVVKEKMECPTGVSGTTLGPSGSYTSGASQDSPRGSGGVPGGGSSGSGHGEGHGH